MAYSEPKHTHHLISDISVLPNPPPDQTWGEGTSVERHSSDTFPIPTIKGRSNKYSKVPQSCLIVLKLS